MSAYSTKKVLVDLGFLAGYFYTGAEQIDDETWHEAIMDTFNRIEEFVVEGSLLEKSPKESEYRKLLHDLGFIRGWAWQKKTPHAISDAMTRVIDYFTETLDATQIVFAAPEEIEAAEDMISDDNRQQIKEEYRMWPQVSSISDTNDFPIRAVERTLKPIRNHDAEAEVTAQISEDNEEAQDLDVSPARCKEAEPDLADTRGQMSRQQKHSMHKDQAEVVRRMSETMTDGEIGAHFCVSRDTVIRYRKEYGIEKKTGPRDGQTRFKIQWEPWQKQKLAEMKLTGEFSWKQIGDELGKTANQCSGMWHWVKQKPEKPIEPHDHVESDAIDAEQARFENSSAPSFQVWKHSPIDTGEWPAIQKMLADGRSREAIAGDFDVPVPELNAFIDDRLREGHERRAAKVPAPGEAVAPITNVAAR